MVFSTPLPPHWEPAENQSLAVTLNHTNMCRPWLTCWSKMSPAVLHPWLVTLDSDSLPWVSWILASPGSTHFLELREPMLYLPLMPPDKWEAQDAQMYVLPLQSQEHFIILQAPITDSQQLSQYRYHEHGGIKPLRWTLLQIRRPGVALWLPQTEFRLLAATFPPEVIGNWQSAPHRSSSSRLLVLLGLWPHYSSICLTARIASSFCCMASNLLWLPLLNPYYYV